MRGVGRKADNKNTVLFSKFSEAKGAVRVMAVEDEETIATGFVAKCRLRF